MPKAFSSSLALSVSVSLLCGAALADTPKTPLTSIGLVDSIDATTDEDDPGIGGGIDASNYFRNVLGSTIAACTRQVSSAVNSWIKSQRLSPILRETSAAHLLLHASKAGLNGFFEISYRFSETQKRARVTVFFVGNDARLQEPSSIPNFLNEYAIATFQDALENAVRCGEG